jgi:hypothetical protein
MSHHDSMLPRTDGERHRSEGTMSSNNMGRNESEDTETLRIMQEAGFDPAMPIDPSSLKAIQELLTPKQSQRKSPSTMEDSKPSAIPNLVAEDTKENASLDPSSVGASLEHVPSEVLRPISLGRVTSDLTMGALRSEAPFEEDQTDASTAGSTQRTGGNMEKRILDQMQMQTALLIDLQRRVDELTHIVISQQGQLQQQHQQQQQQGALVTRQATIVNQAVPQQQARNIPPMHPQARNAPAAAAAAAAAQEPAQLPAVPQQMFFFAFFTSIPTYIRSTRVAKVCRLFWYLQKRDMRDRIDFNLFIKILFMGAILIAKFTNSQKRRKSIKSKFQTHVLVLLVFGGFLIQTGYARFLRNFFIKQRYAQRIWAGEEIDATVQPHFNNAERQRRERQERQVQEANEDEGPGFLRGGIARAPAQGGIVGKFVMDIVYLFGSFLLSIFPMWKAEPRQPRNVQANDDQANDDQANAPHEGDDGAAE